MKIKKKRKYVKSTRNTTLLVYWNPVYSTPFPQKQSKSWLMWQLFLPFSLQYYLLCMFVHISKIHRSFHGCFILLENEISFIFSWISHSCSLQVLVSRLCSSHKMSQVFPFLPQSIQQIFEYLLALFTAANFFMVGIIPILEELANKIKLNLGVWRLFKMIYSNLLSFPVSFGNIYFSRNFSLSKCSNHWSEIPIKSSP